MKGRHWQFDDSSRREGRAAGTLPWCSRTGHGVSVVLLAQCGAAATCFSSADRIVSGHFLDFRAGLQLRSMRGTGTRMRV